MMEDPDVIFWLQPLNQRAISVFSHIRNKVHFVPGYSVPDIESRESTPATVVGDESDITQKQGASSKLLFKFSHERRDPKRGIVFGSSKTCETFLGHAEEGISARHFRISIDQHRRLFLESNSKASTSVSYNGQAKDELRRKWRWILLPEFNLEVEIAGITRRGVKFPSLEFSIHISTCTSSLHETLTKAYVEETRKANEEYMNGSGNLDLHLLDVSLATAGVTEPASPREDPIYIKNTPIGAGASGLVYQGINVSTAQVYAIKDLHKFSVVYKMREVEIVKSLSHDHLITFVDFIERVEYQWLVTEYAEGGSVQKQRKELALDDIAIMVSHVSDGLEYLHARGIIHRDIKPGNILIKSTIRPFVFVVCDFGLANYSIEATTFCGSPRFLPPEVSHKAAWSPAGDVWSLGVVVCDLTIGTPPMERTTIPETWYRDLMSRAETSPSNDLADLVSTGMLKYNPEDRLSASDCCREASMICRKASENRDASPAPISKLAPSTPTEAMSSSGLRRAVKGAVDPEACTAIARPDNQVRSTSKRDRSTAASSESRSPAGVIETIEAAQTHNG